MRRWNSMREIRTAMGLPLGNEHIEHWLNYWDTLSMAEKHQIRTVDLSDASSWSNLPKPNYG